MAAKIANIHFNLLHKLKLSSPLKLATSIHLHISLIKIVNIKTKKKNSCHFRKVIEETWLWEETKMQYKAKVKMNLTFSKFL